jgi:predicted DNA-binding protein (UPF0251 family)
VKRTLRSAAIRMTEAAERVVVSRRAMVNRLDQSAGRVSQCLGCNGCEYGVLVVVAEARSCS